MGLNLRKTISDKFYDIETDEGRWYIVQSYDEDKQG